MQLISIRKIKIQFLSTNFVLRPFEDTIYLNCTRHPVYLPLVPVYSSYCFFIPLHLVSPQLRRPSYLPWTYVAFEISSAPGLPVLDIAGNIYGKRLQKESRFRGGYTASSVISKIGGCLSFASFQRYLLPLREPFLFFPLACRDRLKIFYKDVRCSIEP